MLSLANINVANVLEKGRKDSLNCPLAVVMLVANWLSQVLFLGDIRDFLFRVRAKCNKRPSCNKSPMEKT